MLKRVGHLGLAIIVVIAPLVVGLSRTALADPGTCPVTVSPQSIYADSSTDFTVSITNSNSTAIQWMLINPPSSNYSFVAASANGWNANVLDSQDILITGNSLAPGDSLDIDVSTQVGDYQAGENDWNIYASDTPDASDGYSCIALYGSTMTDNTPEISDVAVSNVTLNSVTISWMTSVPASSQVFYGPDSNYGSASPLDNSTTTNHSVTLKNLTTNTNYHYEVQSTTSATTQTSGDNTFVTATEVVPSTGSQTTSSVSTPLSIVVTNPADTTPPSINWTYQVPGVLTASPTITGTASDKVSVAAVQYSIDAGKDWLRVDSMTPASGKAVTFRFTPLNLADGTYNILARAINSGGKMATTSVLRVVVDRYPPTVGGTVFSSGPQELYPDSQNTLQMISGVPMNVTLSAIGGATSVSVNAVYSKTGLSSSNYNLQQDQDSGLWHGTVDVTNPGTYKLIAHGENGAGRVTDRTIGTVHVEAPGGVVMHGSNLPVAGAKVTVYYLSHETNSWVPWDGTPYGQTNPQTTSKAGTYALLLAAGIYYLKVTAHGYQTVNSTIFTLNQPTPVSAVLTMRDSLHIGPLHIPWFNLSAQPLYWGQQPTTKAQDSSSTTQVGTLLASFTLTDVNGTKHSSLDWLGKPTIVSIMSPWAPATSDEMQALSKVRTNQSVNVVPIGLQANSGQLLAYNTIAGSNLPWLADPTSITTNFLTVGSVPTNYFVDSDGTIKKVEYGYVSKAQILQDLAGL